MQFPPFKSIFSKIDSFHNSKKETITKDLFSMKLGHKISKDFNSMTKRNTSILKRPSFFKNINSFPKSNSNSSIYNSLNSINKEDNLSIISSSRNKPISFFKNENKLGIENNKQICNTPFGATFKNFNTVNKKDYKTLLDKISNKINDINCDLNKFGNRTKSENEFDNKSNKSKTKISEDKKTNKSNINIYFNNNNHNTKTTKENNKNNKDTLEYKYLPHKNNKKNRIKTKSENKSNIKDDKKSIIFMKYFFEDFIEIVNVYDSFQDYKSLINMFNETYFCLFEIKSFPENNNVNYKFLDTYKYSCILITCLIFLAKDENLYKENVIKMKELLHQYIYICIFSMDYKTLNSAKINFFIDKTKLTEKCQDQTLLDKLNEIINLLFLEKMNEYKKIRKCLKQLANNIGVIKSKQILSLVNKSILFCHNCKYYKDENKDNNTENIKTDSSIKNENILDESNNDINDKIEPPFIKKNLNKKFCLIFDLNETLIHNMNLPFGDYFFVRPGFFDLMKKVHKIYEIIIFTEEKKNYVDNIKNKIDYKNYVDYILYKKHLIYEENKPIKKLELIGRDLNKIIYVDNSEISAKYNKKNLYKISSWYNNIFDDELIKLKEKLINIAKCEKYAQDITKGLNTNL